MNNIDIWGKCPNCKINWDKGGHSDVGLVWDVKANKKYIKCDNCKSTWEVEDFPKSWKNYS